MSEAGLSFDTATSRGGELRDPEADVMRERTDDRFATRSEALLGLMDIFMSGDKGEVEPMVWDV
jgi:hypothetical protein